MGKLEWYFGGRSSSSRRRATTSTDIDHSGRRHSLPSCMSTLFHFFDFRSSRFTHIVFDNRHSSSFDLSHHQPPLRPKASHHGVEAPRNSLELDGDSISCLRNKEEYLQLQMGLQIKTRNGSTKSKESDQPLPNNDHIIALESPSTKTPNLLARLMGLDNFPQITSSSSYCRCGPNLGTHSLPESPRVSSSRLSDVDYCHHRRLSLQINQEKENNNIKICEEIIKQEKKKVGRKVALVDITNSNNKVRFEIQEIGSSQGRKVEMKSLKKHKKTIADESSSSKVVRRNQKTVIVSKKQKLISMPMQISKRSASEREAFDRPTSNNLLLNHSTIFLVKKEASPPATKVVPREQPCSYPKGKAKPAGGETNAVDTTTTTDDDDGGSTEFKCIKTIQINSKRNSNWVPTSTFQHLETTASAAAEERRWNRRLVLQMALVGGDQIPNNKSWQVRRGTKREWEFPRAKCEVVEYNDALINKDLEKSKLIIMAEEIEGIVKLVELHILDSLLRETLALIS